MDEIFTVDLTVTTYCQIDSEDFVKFCGLLRKRELYILTWNSRTRSTVNMHHDIANDSRVEEGSQDKLGVSGR